MPGCSTEPSDGLQNNYLENGLKTEADKYEAVTETIADCMYAGDTVLANGTSVKYINLDSFYTIKVGINGHDTVLAYKFDCSTPYRYIPKYFFYSGSSLFLSTSTSPNYRHLVVCELANDHFVINQFMTERPDNSDKDFFVYKINSDVSKLYATGIFNSVAKYNEVGKSNTSTRSFSLPQPYQHYLIDHSEINEKEILVYFTNNKSISIPIK